MECPWYTNGLKQYHFLDIEYIFSTFVLDMALIELRHLNPVKQKHILYMTLGEHQL